MNPNDTENQNVAPQAEPANDAAPEAAPTPEADPIAVLEAEKADLKDKMLRLMADMENLRRRTEREIADARTYAVANFARDMLNVADNVRRAIESVPEEARGTAEGAFKGLIEGIDLTERDLLKTLERHGVKKLDPQGQKFDPNLHQAMFEVPNPDVPNGTVVQVVQSGYVIGERVLRPALVGVAKGGPKAPNGTGSEGGSQEAGNPSTAS
jgi:molecular chaperone GrpE